MSSALDDDDAKHRCIYMSVSMSVVLKSYLHWPIKTVHNCWCFLRVVYRSESDASGYEA